jgi:hypothetical protein
MTGRARLAIGADRPVRHAVEVRQASFVNAEFRELAARYGVAVVVADTAGKWPLMLDPAGDVVYVRLHGDVRIYTSGYSDRALAAWASRIRRWADEGRAVYVYFDNDVKVRAPFDALGLIRALGLEWHPPEAGGGEMPRHGSHARIPRGRRDYGPRVTGGSAWETLRRARASGAPGHGPAEAPRDRATPRLGGRSAGTRRRATC